MGLESAERVQPKAQTEPQPQPTGVPTSGQDVRAPAGLGNAATSWLLARQSAPSPPTLPPDPPDVAAVVEPCVRKTLVRSVQDGEDLAQFIDRLHQELKTTLAPQPAVFNGVEKRLEDLGGVAVVHRGTTQDYVSTARLLSRVAGLPAELGIGFVSFGMGLYLNQASRDITSFLLGHTTSEELTGYLLLFLDQLAGPADLLELELEGTVDRLVELRAAYEAATDRDTRQSVGEEIGAVSRRVLMLERALADIRKGAGSAPATGSLELVLASAASRINAIRLAAATEKETRKELHDRPELLQPVQVATEERFGGGMFTTVDPDQAFPEASDAASVKMVGDLAAHVRAESAKVEALHSEIIPSQHPPNFETFGQVYHRWFAFFSPAVRDADPMYRQANQLFEVMWQALGMAGVEGGLGRFMIMDALGPRAANWIGGAETDFAGELFSGRPERRQATTGGTAASPDFAYAETYGRTKTPGYGPAAEEASREKLTTMRGLETRGQFEQIARAGADRVQKAKELGVIGDRARGSLVLRSDRARDVWNYLIGAQDPLTDIWTWEEKTMPREIASYLLARQQQVRTLTAEHRPGYGEADVRSGGVERAHATATARYVEGFTPMQLAQGAHPHADASSQVAAGQRIIDDARRRALPKGAGNPEQQMVKELLAEMERYLDEYFSSNDEAAHRIAGVLRIANYEYNVAGRFMEQLKPEKLAEALAIAVVIQGILALVARFGGIVGQVLAKAVEKALEKMNISAGAAAIGALAFLVKARSAASFSEARGYAYFTKGIADDLGQIVQDLAVNTTIKGFKAVDVRKGATPKEVLRDLEPVLKDPEVREVFREQIDTAIAERQRLAGSRNEADPELDDLLAMRTELRRLGAEHAPAGAKDPSGGTRGPDVYQHESTRTMGPRDLDGQVTRLVGGEGWAVEGTTLTRAGENRYHLDVPQQAGVAARVEVTTVSTTPERLGTSQHGAEGGDARVELTPPDKAGGPWRARVLVDRTLTRDNVRFVVGHELDEVASIVHRYPTATRAQVAAEMQAGVFTATPGPGPARITAHDRATAAELFELHLAQEEAIIALANARQANNGPEVRSLETQIQRRMESMDRLIGWMALHDPTNIDLKIRALRTAGREVRLGVGRTESWDAVVGELQHAGAEAITRRYHAATGGVPPQGHPIDTALVAHLRYANPHAVDPVRSPGEFRESGINGGHDDDALHAFVADNPQYRYAIVPDGPSRGAGQVTYRTYQQYLWTGTGPMPRVGDANFPRPGQPPPAGWTQARYPKTTVDNMDGFLREVDGAVAAWRGKNPGANLPDGELQLMSPNGVPITAWVRGGRVVTAYPPHTWVGGAAAPAPGGGGGTP